MRYHDHMLYCLLDMAAGDGCNYYFLCWAIFFPFTPITAQKIKIKKQNTWIYHPFTDVCQKLRSDDARFLTYGA